MAEETKFADSFLDLSNLPSSMDELLKNSGSTNAFNKGKIVATFVQGTKELYRYVDHNNLIELKPVDYTNDVGIIAQNDKVVAICSALEVDCMGQVNADTRGTTVFSGVGGQQDFLRGAEQSKNGKPIIALPSTAKAVWWMSTTRAAPTLWSVPTTKPCPKRPARWRPWAAA